MCFQGEFTCYIMFKSSQCRLSENFFCLLQVMRIWESEGGRKCLKIFSSKKAAFHFHPLGHHLIIITSSLGYLYINWAINERIKVSNNNSLLHWDSLEEGKGVKWEWKDTQGELSHHPSTKNFPFLEEFRFSKGFHRLSIFVFFQSHLDSLY